MAKLILDGRQQGLFRPETTWKPPTELPDLTRMDVVSIDTETCDPNLKEKGSGSCRNDGYIVGVSVAWHQEGRVRSLYAPFRHQGGDNLPPENVIAWLNHFFKNFTGLLVGMNFIYDASWFLATNGIDMSRVMNEEIKLWDIMFSEALIDENKSRYNLDSIAETYSFQKKDESLLNEAARAFGVDPKGGLWALPARYVGAYAEWDAGLPLQIYHKQKAIIEMQKLERVHGLEHSLVPCLLTMKMRGIRVNVAKAEQHRDMFLKEYDALLGQIKEACGLPLEVFSADSVARGFDQLSITYPKTGTGKPSFTDPWLSGHISPFAKLITLARRKHKAASAFCEGMVLNKHHNGRVHCEFHPLRSDEGGAVTGRFSCSNPNLQATPAGNKDPEMFTLIRGLFLPDEGMQWAAVDYSSQEPRLTVHFAEAAGCTRAAEVAQRYRDNPRTDYHDLVASFVFGKDFTKAQRKTAKGINLGLAYSMGPAKLCRQLGLPTQKKISYNGKEYEVAGPEGQAILDRYNTEVPFVKELSTQLMRAAEEQGAIRTISGRMCRFPFYEPRNGGRALRYDAALKAYGQGNIKRAFLHTALNRKVQGSAACLTKIAMRNLYREGLVPLLTMHDEIGISVEGKVQARRVAEIMNSCVTLRVPLVCDIDLGPSWGESSALKGDDV